MTSQIGRQPEPNQEQCQQPRDHLSVRIMDLEHRLQKIKSKVNNKLDVMFDPGRQQQYVTEHLLEHRIKQLESKQTPGCSESITVPSQQEEILDLSRYLFDQIHQLQKKIESEVETPKQSQQQSPTLEWRQALDTIREKQDLKSFDSLDRPKEKIESKDTNNTLDARFDHGQEEEMSGLSRYLLDQIHQLQKKIETSEQSEETTEVTRIKFPPHRGIHQPCTLSLLVTSKLRSVLCSPTLSPSSRHMLRCLV